MTLLDKCLRVARIALLTSAFCAGSAVLLIVVLTLSGCGGGGNDFLAPIPAPKCEQQALSKLDGATVCADEVKQ